VGAISTTLRKLPTLAGELYVCYATIVNGYMRFALSTLLILLVSALLKPVTAQIHQDYPIALDGDIPGICQGCGIVDDPIEPWRLATLPNWGYGYADLLRDLTDWGKSPYVTIDSIGASVQNRALWELTITSPTSSATPRRSVFLHTRTHPNEVQTTWVINEVIAYLLSDDSYARRLRDNVVFHIVPMYNPDGVELEYGRQNANGVDLERDWEFDVQQPESAALKREFIRLMNSESPIKVAINLHSAVACQRYFVYHHRNGTSEDYSILQRQFIEQTRSYFSTGIQPWNYNITWDTGRPALFPESWWWRTQQEKVLALTYEDMNCESAGEYDSTAYAIVNGIGKWLGIDNVLSVDNSSALAGESMTLDVMPNPVSRTARIRFTVAQSGPATLTLYDPMGRMIQQLFSGSVYTGETTVRLQTSGIPAGMYFCTLQTAYGKRTIPISIIQ
jgi:hypothetical protein